MTRISFGIATACLFTFGALAIEPAYAQNADDARRVAQALTRDDIRNVRRSLNPDELAQWREFTREERRDFVRKRLQANAGAEDRRVRDGKRADRGDGSGERRRNRDGQARSTDPKLTSRAAREVYRNLTPEEKREWLDMSQEERRDYVRARISDADMRKYQAEDARARNGERDRRRAEDAEEARLERERRKLNREKRQFKNEREREAYRAELRRERDRERAERARELDEERKRVERRLRNREIRLQEAEERRREIQRRHREREARIRERERDEDNDLALGLFLGAAGALILPQILGQPEPTPVPRVRPLPAPVAIPDVRVRATVRGHWEIDPNACPDLREDIRDQRVTLGAADLREDRRDSRTINCPPESYRFIPAPGQAPTTVRAGGGALPQLAPVTTVSPGYSVQPLGPAPSYAPQVAPQYSPAPSSNYIIRDGQIIFTD